MAFVPAPTPTPETAAARFARDHTAHKVLDRVRFECDLGHQSEERLERIYVTSGTSAAITQVTSGKPWTIPSNTGGGHQV